GLLARPVCPSPRSSPRTRVVLPAPKSPEMKSTRPAPAPAASASPKPSVADADLSAAEPRLLEWLAQGWHGEMEYMARHGALRARPAELKPGTLRVISCRMNYLNDSPQGLEDFGDKAV